MSVNLIGLPFALAWDQGVEPPSWTQSDTGLYATAAAQTDWYTYAPDPNVATRNAAALLGVPPDGDWQLSARITVGFNGTYDAGALALAADDAHWAKFCFEFSPQSQGMVVSVVTNGVSDDANGWTVEGNAYWFRISRLGKGFAFHASADGEHWEFVRCFALHSDLPLRTGLLVQAPSGQGCEVAFESLAFKAETLKELRDGS
ncbi:DUF1349 domain-containing protein [Glycomyces tarimensis]